MVVTSGKDWRRPREEGIEITLPSGNTAKLRPVGAEWFLNQESIPDLLTPIIAAEAEGRDWSEDEKATASLNELGKSKDFLNSLVKAFFASPKVVDNPEADDEISPEDVEYQDKLVLMQLIGTPAVALRQFREKQIRNAAPLSTIQANAAETKQADDDTHMGESDTGDDGQLDAVDVRSGGELVRELDYEQIK